MFSSESLALTLIFTLIHDMMTAGKSNECARALVVVLVDACSRSDRAGKCGVNLGVRRYYYCGSSGTIGSNEGHDINFGPPLRDGDCLGLI